MDNIPGFLNPGYFGRLRFHPHFHSLILEGGFDEQGNFIYVPITDLEKMKECFRQLIIKYFLDTGLFLAGFCEKPAAMESWQPVPVHPFTRRH